MSAGVPSRAAPVPWLAVVLLAAASASAALSCVVGRATGDARAPGAPLASESAAEVVDGGEEVASSLEERDSGAADGSSDEDPATGEEIDARDTDTDPDATGSPAMRYAALGPAACRRELSRRAIAHRGVESARGVAQPIRLSGPIGGVTYRSQLPERSRATAAIEIVDCRLALALDDLATILRRHDVVEAIHYSVYRPPPRRWPAGKLGKRHGAAMAIDLATLVRRDGTKLDVLRDFHGQRGRRPCGERAVLRPKSDDAVELRAIVCELIDARMFHIALTPGFNKKHENHLHLELSPNAKWFYVR